MKIRVFPKQKQGQGAFNGGEIVENKPIAFPREGGELRPFSNLFYWAHARAVVDSTIGLHPHQGFEICSFVLRGQIRHFDTKLREWRPLETGDVQIIRAGNGISHSEFMGKDSEMFQIWFDPNLNLTLSKSASYDDYRSADFPVQNFENAEVKTLVGAGSPFRMDTPNVEIWQLDLHGDFSMSADPAKIYSAYLVSGEADLAGEKLVESDFAVATEASELRFSTGSAARIFMIASPAEPGYNTYAKRSF